ncbi:hypothetical protein NLI96_g6366 [Meripilus lineatus]|uniref:Uncharacterized protein n=1 Tax=Meripilus lineatus TaxID=2056292 RepID=A0AAD5V6D2_9APHY|nr:hypothetical protein NLI96_g6366 [Physisporinus lineatus]
MCKMECFGNFHRKCQGAQTPSAKLQIELVLMNASQVYEEDRRVQNLIQDRCDACKRAAWRSLGIEERHGIDTSDDFW